MMLVILIAQAAPADPISGGAGWLGAGLLGLVLGWLLLIHLPAKDKQLATLIEAKDSHVNIVIAAFKEEAREQRQAHREALNRVCDEFKSDCEGQRESHEKTTESISRSVEALAQKVQR